MDTAAWVHGAAKAPPNWLCNQSFACELPVHALTAVSAAAHSRTAIVQVPALYCTLEMPDTCPLMDVVAAHKARASAPSVTSQQHLQGRLTCAVNVGIAHPTAGSTH